MSGVKTAILVALIAAGILVPAIMQRQAQLALRAENDTLRQQAQQALRLSVENRRLSNSLADTRRVGAELKEQLQEVFKLRAEVKRLQQQNRTTNALVQTATNNTPSELATLIAEVTRLRQETQDLQQWRDQLQQLQSEAAASPASDTATNQPAPALDQQLAIRLIRTQGPSFAEKLKQSVGAKEDDTFEDVFARFLQVNGIAPSTVSAAAYDERTGRVIIRAAPSTLDQIERLTAALDRGP